MLTTLSVLALLTSAFVNQSAPATPRQAPEITWTVPGQGQQMLRQYLGKVVAIEFIYTTCSHCLIPAQALQKLQQEMGEQGLQTIAVAFNPNASVLTEAFVNDQHLTLPVGWTFGEQVSSFLGYAPTDRFVVPQIVLIDRAGVIRYQTRAQGHDDLRTEPVLRQRILELLQPVNPAAKAAEPNKTRR
jgi:peroxiredoxin